MRMLYHIIALYMLCAYPKAMEGIESLKKMKQTLKYFAAKLLDSLLRTYPQVCYFFSHENYITMRYLQIIQYHRTIYVIPTSRDYHSVSCVVLLSIILN